MSEGHLIPVEIHGQRYPIRSTLDPEYVARLAGRTQNAAESLRQALQLYDHKGNLVLAAKARNGLRELARNR